MHPEVRPCGSIRQMSPATDLGDTNVRAAAITLSISTNYKRQTFPSENLAHQLELCGYADVDAMDRGEMVEHHPMLFGATNCVSMVHGPLGR